jgi:branched-chain amino acid transport system permease protein
MWTIVWALAGVLSAVGVFLRGPLVGLPLGGFVGPLLLLYGLAAAVMARMEKLSTAMLAGAAIGIADFASVYATNSSRFSSATMLVLILGALLLQRRGLSRAFDTGVASWETATDQRTIPSELRDLPIVRHGRRGVAAAGLLAAVAVPWIVGASSVGFATIAVVYAMVGVSLVILTGWAGQISLGQFAFAGVGAAVTGKLVADFGFDLFLALAIAGIVGALVAVLIGLPALRIQGLFLAVVTLAFAFTVGNLVLDRNYFGWLLPSGRGFIERPVLWSRIDLTTDSRLFGVTFAGDTKMYLLALAMLLLSMGMAKSLRRYRSGRVFIATRDNERVAEAFGVSPARTRLAAFAISGFIAALAGGVFAIHLGSVSAGVFRPELSIQLFVMTVIGGITSVGGAILGAIFLQGLPMLGLRDLPVIGPVVEILGTGLGILLILSFLPGGLAQGVAQVRDNWLRRLAERRGIVVPSLLADVRVAHGEDDDLEDLIRHATTSEHTAVMAGSTTSGGEG